MVKLIVENSYNFWFSISVLCLVVEIIGAYGYLLCSGIAALIVGVIVYIIPQIIWEWQGFIFSVLIIAVAFLWWSLLSEPSYGESINIKMLNRRLYHLIGTHATLTEAMHNGIGRINIGDSSWRAKASHDLPVGTVVEVIKTESTTLVIRPIAS